jgi:hypothetical protein
MALKEELDEWPCTHDCTSFFSIPVEEIAPLVPPPLVPHTDARGRGEIEIGFARFRASHGLPPCHELSWGIAVKRLKGRGMAFYAPMIASDTTGFLDLNESIGFTVFRPTVRFTSDFDRRSFEVSDAQGKTICVLRLQPEELVCLPSFLQPLVIGDSEVWTGSEGALQRRTFSWRGVARGLLHPSVAATLCDHPFFRGARVSRAHPVPHRQLSSAKTADAVQLFGRPAPA